MKNVASIEKLFKLSEGELTTILGNATNAKLLWEFIHKDNTTQAKASTTFKSKRWYLVILDTSLYLYKHTALYFNNWFMILAVRLSSYGCTRQVAKHERSLRVAEYDSSFWSTI